MTEVRLASLLDEEPLMSLLREMHQENGMSAIDEDRVRATLRRGLSQQYALVGVIRGPKEIEASVGLFASQWWYSNAQHLEDLWNYVSEPYRRSDNAKNLLQFARWASEQLQRPLVMGVINTERTAAKSRLYRRTFGEPLGATFLVNGKPPDPIVAVA